MRLKLFPIRLSPLKAPLREIIQSVKQILNTLYVPDAVLGCLHHPSYSFQWDWNSRMYIHDETFHDGLCSYDGCYAAEPWQISIDCFQKCYLFYSFFLQNSDDEDEEEEVPRALTKSNSNFDLSPTKNNNNRPNAMYRTGIVSVANKNTNSSADIVQQKYLRCYDRTLERRPISSPFSTSLPTLKSSSSSPNCSLLWKLRSVFFF